MNIQLNGKPRSTLATTLAQLLAEAGFGSATVATAVNGAFVPLALRTRQDLKDGDQIEVLAPMQGG
ncbi:sulfur carrier protein ThiS [Parasedimentitalea psychrophila]|uniref:Sulfur carrier protein ThiS n=1 Tax=Parasedimentitalea psychrophila TaxID=2997337 RepID=A0A9Y2KVD3_9RHOB|nr:sulfur carrier protein ThiS [Parasedimentitalea psychrophila]WIY23855.1 sulfur carrier protein ThiS [Parasedimentitalea psychrophila]